MRRPGKVAKPTRKTASNAEETLEVTVKPVQPRKPKTTVKADTFDVEAVPVPIPEDESDEVIGFWAEPEPAAEVAEVEPFEVVTDDNDDESGVFSAPMPSMAEVVSSFEAIDDDAEDDISFLSEEELTYFDWASNIFDQAMADGLNEEDLPTLMSVGEKVYPTVMAIARRTTDGDEDYLVKVTNGASVIAAAAVIYAVRLKRRRIAEAKARKVSAKKRTRYLK